jgi:hypothetical protein
MYNIIYNIIYYPLHGVKRTVVTSRVLARGKNVTQIVTPSVVKAVREHFGCSTLNGAELEDGGGAGTAGSHWEKLLFGPEFMTGVTSGAEINPYSAITFALFQDSGWYQVNISLSFSLSPVHI